MSTEPSHLPLTTPEHFPSFPYDPPYPIQLELMRHVFASIEDPTRKVAIVESPTGTVQCSVLCFLLSFLEQNVKIGKDFKPFMQYSNVADGRC